MRFKQKQRSAQKTNGSSQSFEALYEDYFDRIYGYIASRLEDVNEVEDVVSDVFLKVMVKLDQFRGDNLTSWLFTIAHHTLMDMYRTRQPQSTELEEDTVVDCAEQIARQRLSVLRLAEALGSVSEACRQRGMKRTILYDYNPAG